MADTYRDKRNAKREHGLIEDRDWDTWGWLRSYPHWHDDLFHTRPSQRKEKALLHEASLGAGPVDWPDHRKPHKYYW